MLESSRCARAGRKNLVVARTDVGHLFVRDRAVIERRAPVRTALKHREFADFVRDLADHLDCGRTSADDADPFAGQFDRLMRPIESMERAPLEGLHALQPRQPVRGEGPRRQLARVIRPQP